MMSNNPVFRDIKKRLWKLNKNWLCCIVGDTGSGKSWASLRIAELVSDRFTADNVYFSAVDFINAVKKMEIKKGDVAVLDEAGVSWGSREWQKKNNRDMSKLFQIMRLRNFGVIMTVPSLYFVDKHGRDLLHAICRTMGINYKDGYCRIEYKIHEFNPIINKSYRKFPRIVTTSGAVRKIRFINIKKPSRKLIKEYELKKDDFVKQFLDTRDQAETMPVKELVKPNTRCLKCNHEWFYKGAMLKARCTNCYGVVNVRNM